MYIFSTKIKKLNNRIPNKCSLAMTNLNNENVRIVLPWFNLFSIRFLILLPSPLISNYFRALNWSTEEFSSFLQVNNFYLLFFSSVIDYVSLSFVLIRYRLSPFQNPIESCRSWSERRPNFFVFSVSISTPTGNSSITILALVSDWRIALLLRIAFSNSLSHLSAGNAYIWDSEDKNNFQTTILSALLGYLVWIPISWLIDWYYAPDAAATWISIHIRIPLEIQVNRIVVS